jgi:hypothetical protein
VTRTEKAFFVLEGGWSSPSATRPSAAAMDRYFRELEALWVGPTPPDRQAELDLMRRPGMTPGSD